MNWDDWSDCVADILEDMGYTVAAVNSLDWESWQELYWSEGLTPQEAVNEEMRTD